MKRLLYVLHILKRVLQELADESPYRRHLAAHHREDTPEEWQRFLDEHLTRKYKRPKCC